MIVIIVSAKQEEKDRDERYVYHQGELYQGEARKFFLLQSQPLSGQTLLAPTVLQVNWPKDKEQENREKTQ